MAKLLAAERGAEYGSAGDERQFAPSSRHGEVLR
jgi:hypothetical protein